MADGSSLGWRYVEEYERNPLAEGSDDEKRMLKSESRAQRKVREERAKRRDSKRSRPYNRRTYVPPSATVTTPAPTQGYPITHQPMRNRIPPGVCYDCGQPGHWRGSPQCSGSHNRSNNKLSTSLCLICKSNKVQNDTQNALNVESEGTQTSGNTNTENLLKSPVGGLKRHYSKWSEATDSRYILDVVQNGYRLPLKAIPESAVLKNNKTARDNPIFVEQEIGNLLKKGIVSECQEIPHVVNPLTVAYNRKGKPRLVLDARHLNDKLHQFKIKFEDVKIAETLFEENSFLFTFDLKGAYHHIDIFEEHRTYLGFSFATTSTTKYYVFNSLPFGIKTIGHIFTKVLKVVVSYLRTKSHKVIMFLDDGIGGERNYEAAIRSSEYTKQTLLEFGFLLAEEKCNWEPALKVTWLGHMIDMESNMLFISEERIQRLENIIKSSIYQIEHCEQRLIPVRHLARVVGHIISMHHVISNKTRLMTREMLKCIDTRTSWNAHIKVNDKAMKELYFWKENVRTLNQTGKHLKHKHVCLYNVFVDASSSGYGGYIEKIDNVHNCNPFGECYADNMRLDKIENEKCQN